MATLPTGATIYELKNGGIEYLAGGDRVFIGNHNSMTTGPATEPAEAPGATRWPISFPR